MKTICTILFAATITLVACNSKTPAGEITKDVKYEDTVGFAQFQTLKQNNERWDPNQEADKASPAPAKTSTAKSSSSKATSAPVATAPAPAQKKGWSKAAKGTVIGAGSGAVLGAIINKKNRAAGAVIGGAAGGGVGYGIGRSKDKKDGRY